MREDTKKLCISVDEMAVQLGISRAGAFALAHSAGFPTVTIGRRMLIPLAALEKWLESQAGARQQSV